MVASKLNFTQPKEGGSQEGAKRFIFDFQASKWEHKTRLISIASGNEMFSKLTLTCFNSTKFDRKLSLPRDKKYVHLKSIYLPNHLKFK